MTSDTPNTNNCADCQTQPGKFEIRRRNLCPSCLTNYIGTKALKRTEAYTFKNVSGQLSKHRLFLPLSGGVSSLALLEILNAHQLRQIAKQNRVSFDLVIGHVDLTGSPDAQTWLEKLQKRYERHAFIPTMKIEDALSADPSIAEGLTCLGLRKGQDEQNGAFLERIFSIAASPTTRMDIHQLLLKRLLFATAKSHECDGVVWGHSDTRLAALVLSDVAKGRGGSLTTTLTDGSSQAGIESTYPLRDLFKSELEVYLAAIAQPLTDLIHEHDDDLKMTTGSVRNTAMDTLLTQYISSQGQKYPSIMANVVRTTGKLHQPTPDQVASECRLCLMPILKSSSTSGSAPILCQGCQRIKQDMRT